MNIIMNPGILAVPIDVEDINNYFKEKNLKDFCPQCDSNTWNVGIPDDPANYNDSIPFLVAETRNFSNVSSRGSVVALVFDCANCGYMRLQLARPIIEWKLAKK